MSKKFDDFEAALKALCIKHKIYLYESYDGVEAEDSEYPTNNLDFYIRDNTKQDET